MENRNGKRNRKALQSLKTLVIECREQEKERKERGRGGWRDNRNKDGWISFSAQTRCDISKTEDDKSLSGFGRKKILTVCMQ